MLKFAAAFAAFVLLTAGAPARTIEPVDESAKDPELAALIATLVKAADEKNFKPFEDAISPNAMASFGGDEGVEGFKNAYGLPDPNSPFWAEFKEAVALGGTITSDGETKTTYYATPYTYANWPEDIDSFSNTVAIGPKTMLYAKPEDGAKTLGDVTHQILELVEEAPEAKGAAPEGWVHVKFEGKTGYVKAAEQRSSIDYRLILQKTENRWWIGAFVAGD